MNEGEKTGFSNGRIFSSRLVKNRRRFFFLVLILAALLNVAVAVKSTSALYFQGYTSQHILNEAFAQGIYRCYTAKNGKEGKAVFLDDYPYAGADKTQIQQTISEAGNQYFGYQYLFQILDVNSATLLPNGLAPTVGINCANLINDFAGGTFSNTVYERLGVSREKITFDNKSKREEIDGFMKGMGYSGTTTSVSSGGKTCYAINYRADALSLASSAAAVNDAEWTGVIEVVKPEGDSGARVCVTVGEDGKIVSASNEGWDANIGHGGEYFLAYFDGTKIHFEIWAVTDDAYGHEDCGSYASCLDYSIFKDRDDDTDGAFEAKGKTLKEFEDTLRNTVTQIRYTQGIGAGSSKKYETKALVALCHQDGWLSVACDDSFSFTGAGIGIYVSGITKITDDVAGNTTWNLTGNGNDALKFISDNSTLDSTTKAGSSWNSATISKSEKALLYQWYMANPDIGRTNVKCSLTDEEMKLHPDWTLHTVEWFNSVNEKKTCYVTSFPNDDSVGVVLVDKDGHFNNYLSGIFDLMDAMNYGFNTLTDVDKNDIITADEASAAFEEFLAPNGNPKEDCFSGAGSLGWIICPIIYDFGQLIRDKYVDWVEPALQINTLLFGNGDGSPTYMAWNVFRNIANLAFVIIFLIVIFSQLTGVGIDNYGIKKIVPKLIIGALLINCSYIICQLAIDIANIIGYGIAGVFQWISSAIDSKMPTTIKVEGAVIDPNDRGLLGDGFAGMGAIVVLIVGVLTAASVLSQGAALIVPVLMAILGVSISLFTLIAILGIRQAGAVLLVVASPLAFVCYMLPNTKKVFEKWFKAFQGLLIAFPACSALVYGGDMVGRILLSTSYGSTWILISAAVVSIAPIFLIPKIIRSSMGAVSNAMVNASRGLSRSARNAGNNSRIAKDIRANHEWSQQRRFNLRRAGLDKNYQETARGRRRRERAKDGSYAQMNIARARAAVLNDYTETAQSNRMAGEGGIELLNNQMYGVEEKLDNTAVASAESQIKLGQMTMTEVDEKGKEKEVKINPRSIEDLKKALTQAILKGEDEKQKALTNVLTSKGEDGREAVHEAIEDTEDAAQHMNSSEISKLRATQKSLASHIMDNFSGIYKSNNRSTYDWAARNQTNSQSFDNEFLGGKREWMAKNSLSGRSMSVNNVKGTSLLTMDNKEFRRLADSHASMSDGEKADLTRAITTALNSQASSTADIKRIEDLKDLMKNLGK